MTEPVSPTTRNESWLSPQALPEEPRRSSLRGALLLAAVMFGWVLVIFGMSSIVARNDPNVEVPMPVALGVVVTPADGWYSAADEWDVGEGGIALQKAGIFLAVWVQKYSGTNDELMASFLDELRPGFDSFRALPSRAVRVAEDLPGLVVHFSGISEWGQEENEVVVLSYMGTGVVMYVEALAGQLSWVQGDIDTMLSTLTVPR